MKYKLTKGELKRQRDQLSQFERYLPTLQLKKQQLQIEILNQTNNLLEKAQALQKKIDLALPWMGLLSEPGVDLKPWLVAREVRVVKRNVAGVDIPIFERTEFAPAEYDLFIFPLWVDHALDILRQIVGMQKEMQIIEQGIRILRQELRITTQRVNLFEKVKIPEAKEAIRAIKIYIGDQMSNAVGRSKIAKAKIERALFVEALV